MASPVSAARAGSFTRRALRSPAVQILLGAVLGVIFGLIVGDWAEHLKFVGDMFIRLIQMSIVPLVMSSVIVATGGVAGRGTGSLMARTFAWILGLSVVSALLGIVLATVLQPGAGLRFEADPSELEGLQDSAGAAPGWQQTILDFVSTNIFDSMAAATTVPIIVFSLVFGLALNSYVRKTGNRTVLDIAEQIQQVVLTMIRFVMFLAPVGVFALLANLTGTVGFAVVTSALSYLGVNLVGVVVMMLALVLVAWAVTGLNPLRLPAKLAEQTVIAVTTTSSAVTFPTVLKNAVEQVGVSQRVANFTLSIGMTMGSCGAVLNYTIVVFFLAQAGDVSLSPGQIVLGAALAILLNIGTITVPGGFPVVAMFLATSLGLPIEAVGLLIAVDWFTGILRTFLNVNGDTILAMLVAKPTNEIDVDVYRGRKTVESERVDLEAMEESFAKADAAD